MAWAKGGEEMKRCRTETHRATVSKMAITELANKWKQPTPLALSNDKVRFKVETAAKTLELALMEPDLTNEASGFVKCVVDCQTPSEFVNGVVPVRGADYIPIIQRKVETICCIMDKGTNLKDRVKPTEWRPR